MTDFDPDHAEEAAANEDMDDIVPSRGYQMVPVVGLGGSAGSIPALQSLLGRIPVDSGMAFVVILHLSRDHESALAAVLQKATVMKVVQVQETARVEPNTVYVIPPRKALKTLDGYLRLAELLPERGRHVTVDLFFRTLADTHGPHAVAIVLSGADGDGAIGIKRIKERGGLTIAQDPGEAEFSGMPRAAIATGMVDWVLPVSEMAKRLVDYRLSENRLRLPPEEGPEPAVPAGPLASGDDESMLRDILGFLRARTGRDFSYYKRATILRRIGRRMQVNSIDNLGAYLSCLRTQPGEAGALLQDLLISVTNFFRDPECFEALTQQIPELFKGKGQSDSVRVWVAACATGEEAYSIAIMLNEHARTLESPPIVQVFATDLDDEAIQIAREGIFPTAIEADVSEERLRRYFIKEHRGYRVRRDVRETVLFAVHDLLKDSPFSRLDLLTCRNLLIYLNRDAQNRALQTFHFALKPEGRLFLGASEAVDEGSSLFSTVDKKHRVYAQRPLPRIGLPMPAGPGSLAVGIESQRGGAEGIALAGRAFEQASIAARGDLRSQDMRAVSWSELHFRLLEHYAPPSILVDAEHDIVHLSRSAGRYLQFTGGEPSHNLLRAVHPSLRVELRAALYEAAQTGAPAEVLGVTADVGEQTISVNVRVWPANDVGSDLFVVTLQSAQNDAGGGGAVAVATPDPVASRLDRELERLKSHLRATVEQYEASTEELKASNEELQAMNEELRSATEELETSREELQSINEELTTVNHELKSKVDELGHANSDMHNLMDATAIATVFLDRELRITRYTPSAVALFSLIPTDVGRPLTDLKTQLQYPTLGDDARRVLERLVPIEREVGQGDGRWFLARLLPYRTIEDRIAGVVLTFVDISERKDAQEALRASEARFRAIIDQATVGVMQADVSGHLTFANDAMCRLLGYGEAELTTMQLPQLIHPLDQARSGELITELLRDHKPYELEERMLRKDGSVVWVHNSVTYLPDEEGRPHSLLVVSVDITERRAAESGLRRSEERMRMVVENARDYAIFTTDGDRNITSWNSGAQRILGFSESEVLGRSADVIFTENDRASGVPEREIRQAAQEGRASDDRFHQRRDGSRFWASGVVMSMKDPAGNDAGFVKILRDQSEARRYQQALELSRSELLEALRLNEQARSELEAANSAKDRFLAVLSHELRTPLMPALMAAQLLGRQKNLPPDVHEKLEMIERNIRVESRLIDDLLDLTRISRGTLEIENERVDLHAVIQAALQICQNDVEGKAQRLELVLDAPRCDVFGDAHRLQQAVWNLLKNASKFTPAEGMIRVSTQVEGAQFVLTVADTGMGIEPETMPGIFDAFVQGGGAVARQFGGMGLGLAITKATIDAHGGTLNAESEGSGQGATFSVRLPLVDH